MCTCHHSPVTHLNIIKLKDVLAFYHSTYIAVTIAIKIIWPVRKEDVHSLMLSDHMIKKLLHYQVAIASHS